MKQPKEFLDIIKDWMQRRWSALMERLRRSRSEARICARLDRLEARVCDRLAELEAYIDGRLAQSGPPIASDLTEIEVRLHGRLAEPEEPVPLGSISVPIGDGQRTVEFQGIELSQRFYAEDLKRITETLYGTSHGQYLVHVRTLHRGKGLRTEYALHEVNDCDLKEGGKYSTLWQMCQPVSLEEALEGR